MINKQKAIPITVPVKTFTCVDCGAKYTVKHATVKMGVTNPKYCRYCMR